MNAGYRRRRGGRLYDLIIGMLKILMNRKDPYSIQYVDDFLTEKVIQSERQPPGVSCIVVSNEREEEG